ncbi:MAG: hypothetical protein LBE01_01130 [Deltaproteobacteria bacterium]|nr:hypothetical protein [Deltaproteobacteria bacterium]
MLSPPVKEFNAIGVCFPSRHYSLPLETRLPKAFELIENAAYFSIKAPRQSGKTTCVKFLADKIMAEGRHYVLALSLAPLWGVNDRNQALTELVAIVNQTMAVSESEALRQKAFAYDSLPALASPSLKIRAFFNSLSESLDKELVVFFDEIDSLAWAPLSSLLAQLMDGYQFRHQPGRNFPRSIALVGQRDVMDRLAEVPPELSLGDGPTLPFEGGREVLTLENFSREDIETLYAQHEAATGQAFAPLAVETAWRWTQGQPWLVNVLARRVVNVVLGQDYSQTVEAAHVEEAAMGLVDDREIPIKSLQERLKEPRVVSVLDPVLAGTNRQLVLNEKDRNNCVSLGILALDGQNRLRPPNPLTREVVSRILTERIQASLDPEISQVKWRTGRRLLLTEILKVFQGYWRQKASSFALMANTLDLASGEILKAEMNQLLDSEISNDLIYHYFVARTNELLVCKYSDSIYSLSLMAYLQKAFSGEAEVFRDFYEGRGGVGVRIAYKGRPYDLEIALKSPDAQNKGLKRLAASMTVSGGKEGWLVVFDQDRAKTWDEKITLETVVYQDFSVNVFGC